MRTIQTVFTLAIILVSTTSIVYAQDTGLIGMWSLIDFTVMTKSNDGTGGEADSFQVTTHTDKSQLAQDSSIWTLDFREEGEVTQTSNMASGELDEWLGTWKTEGSDLTLFLEVNGNQIELSYHYIFEGDVLVLKRTNPRKTMVIMTKFEKNE